jgi:hypothetical protein
MAQASVVSVHFIEASLTVPTVLDYLAPAVAASSFFSFQRK